MIAIRGRVFGNEALSRALGQAPDTIRRRVVGWLWSEKNMFVGRRRTRTGRRGGQYTTNTQGVFRRKLKRKISNMSGTLWADAVVNNFKGHVEGGERRGRIDDMALHMGVYSRSGRTYSRGVGIYSGAPFPEVLEFLQSGGTVSGSGFMIVPVFYNLPRLGAKLSHRVFPSMIRNGELEFFRRGGKIYYFRKDKIGNFRDLLFIGIKRATIRPQFNFVGDWNRRVPKAIQRGQKRIDKAIDIINRRNLTE